MASRGEGGSGRSRTRSRTPTSMAQKLVIGKAVEQCKVQEPEKPSKKILPHPEDTEANGKTSTLTSKAPLPGRSSPRSNSPRTQSKAQKSEANRLGIFERFENLRQDSPRRESDEEGALKMADNGCEAADTHQKNPLDTKTVEKSPHESEAESVSEKVNRKGRKPVKPECPGSKSASAPDTSKTGNKERINTGIKESPSLQSNNSEDGSEQPLLSQKKGLKKTQKVSMKTEKTIVDEDVAKVMTEERRALVASLKSQIFENIEGENEIPDITTDNPSASDENGDPIDSTLAGLKVYSTISLALQSLPQRERQPVVRLPKVDLQPNERQLIKMSAESKCIGEEEVEKEGETQTACSKDIEPEQISVKGTGTETEILLENTTKVAHGPENKKLSPGKKEASLLAEKMDKLIHDCLNRKPEIAPENPSPRCSPRERKHTSIAEDYLASRKMKSNRHEELQKDASPNTYISFNKAKSKKTYSSKASSLQQNEESKEMKENSMTHPKDCTQKTKKRSTEEDANSNKCKTSCDTPDRKTDKPNSEVNPTKEINSLKAPHLKAAQLTDETHKVVVNSEPRPLNKFPTCSKKSSRYDSYHSLNRPLSKDSEKTKENMETSVKSKKKICPALQSMFMSEKKEQADLSSKGSCNQMNVMYAGKYFEFDAATLDALNVINVDVVYAGTVPMTQEDIEKRYKNIQIPESLAYITGDKGESASQPERSAESPLTGTMEMKPKRGRPRLSSYPENRRSTSPSSKPSSTICAKPSRTDQEDEGILNEVLESLMIQSPVRSRSGRAIKLSSAAREAGLAHESSMSFLVGSSGHKERFKQGRCLDFSPERSCSSRDTSPDKGQQTGEAKGKKKLKKTSTVGSPASPAPPSVSSTETSVQNSPVITSILNSAVAAGSVSPDASKGPGRRRSPPKKKTIREILNITEEDLTVEMPPLAKTNDVPPTDSEVDLRKTLCRKRAGDKEQDKTVLDSVEVSGSPIEIASQDSQALGDGKKADDSGQLISTVAGQKSGSTEIQSKLKDVANEIEIEDKQKDEMKVEELESGSNEVHNSPCDGQPREETDSVADIKQMADKAMKDVNEADENQKEGSEEANDSPSKTDEQNTDNFEDYTPVKLVEADAKKNPTLLSLITQVTDHMKPASSFLPPLDLPVTDDEEDAVPEVGKDGAGSGDAGSNEEEEEEDSGEEDEVATDESESSSGEDGESDDEDEGNENSDEDEDSPATSETEKVIRKKLKENDDSPADDEKVESMTENEVAKKPERNDEKMDSLSEDVEKKLEENDSGPPYNEQAATVTEDVAEEKLNENDDCPEKQEETLDEKEGKMVANCNEFKKVEHEVQKENNDESESDFSRGRVAEHSKEDDDSTSNKTIKEEGTHHWKVRPGSSSDVQPSAFKKSPDMNLDKEAPQVKQEIPPSDDFSLETPEERLKFLENQLKKLDYFISDKVKTEVKLPKDEEQAITEYKADLSGLKSDRLQEVGLPKEESAVGNFKIKTEVTDSHNISNAGGQNITGFYPPREPGTFDDNLHSLFEKPGPANKKKASAFLSSELDEYLNKNCKLKQKFQGDPELKKPLAIPSEPATSSDEKVTMTDVDIVDDLVFYSFSTQDALNNYVKTGECTTTAANHITMKTKWQPDSSSFPSAASSDDYKTPEKTHDVTKIKGWKKKFSPGEEPQRSEPQRLSPAPGGKPTVSPTPEGAINSLLKIHWRTKERLLRNLCPEEISALGLSLKQRRRKTKQFTHRKNSKSKRMILESSTDNFEGRMRPPIMPPKKRLTPTVLTSNMVMSAMSALKVRTKMRNPYYTSGRSQAYTCYEEACRNGCICDLSDNSDVIYIDSDDASSASYDQPPPAMPTCGKEYCRLGCLCSLIADAGGNINPEVSTKKERAFEANKSSVTQRHMFIGDDSRSEPKDDPDWELDEPERKKSRKRKLSFESYKNMPGQPKRKIIRIEPEEYMKERQKSLKHESKNGDRSPAHGPVSAQPANGSVVSANGSAVSDKFSTKSGDVSDTTSTPQAAEPGQGNYLSMFGLGKKSEIESVAHDKDANGKVRKSSRLKDRTGIGHIDKLKDLIYFDATKWADDSFTSKKKKGKKEGSTKSCRSPKQTPPKGSEPYPDMNSRWVHGLGKQPARPRLCPRTGILSNGEAGQPQLLKAQPPELPGAGSQVFSGHTIKSRPAGHPQNPVEIIISDSDDEKCDDDPDDKKTMVCARTIAFSDLQRSPSSNKPQAPQSHPFSHLREKLEKPLPAKNLPSKSNPSSPSKNLSSASNSPVKPKPIEKEEKVNDFRNPPVPKVRKQMVLLQRNHARQAAKDKKHPSKVIEIKPEVDDRPPHLLEVQSDCNWHAIRSHLLNQISIIADRDDLPPMGHKLCRRIGEFIVEIRPPAKDPTPLPPNLQTETCRSLPAIRIMITMDGKRQPASKAAAKQVQTPPATLHAAAPQKQAKVVPSSQGVHLPPMVSGPQEVAASRYSGHFGARQQGGQPSQAFMPSMNLMRNPVVRNLALPPVGMSSLSRLNINAPGCVKSSEGSLSVHNHRLPPPPPYPGPPSRANNQPNSLYRLSGDATKCPPVVNQVGEKEQVQKENNHKILVVSTDGSMKSLDKNKAPGSMADAAPCGLPLPVVEMITTESPKIVDGTESPDELQSDSDGVEIQNLSDVLRFPAGRIKHKRRSSFKSEDRSKSNISSENQLCDSKNSLQSPNSLGPCSSVFSESTMVGDVGSHETVKKERGMETGDADAASTVTETEVKESPGDNPSVESEPQIKGDPCVNEVDSNGITSSLRDSDMECSGKSPKSDNSIHLNSSESEAQHDRQPEINRIMSTPSFMNTVISSASPGPRPIVSHAAFMQRRGPGPRIRLPTVSNGTGPRMLPGGPRIRIPLSMLQSPTSTTGQPITFNLNTTAPNLPANTTEPASMMIAPRAIRMPHLAEHAITKVASSQEKVQIDIAAESPAPQLPATHLASSAQQNSCTPSSSPDRPTGICEETSVQRSPMDLSAKGKSKKDRISDDSSSLTKNSTEQKLSEGGSPSQAESNSSRPPTSSASEELPGSQAPPRSPSPESTQCGETGTPEGGAVVEVSSSSEEGGSVLPRRSTSPGPEVDVKDGVLEMSSEELAGVSGSTEPEQQPQSDDPDNGVVVLSDEVQESDVDVTSSPDNVRAPAANVLRHDRDHVREDELQRHLAVRPRSHWTTVPKSREQRERRKLMRMRHGKHHRHAKRAPTTAVSQSREERDSLRRTRSPDGRVQHIQRERLRRSDITLKFERLQSIVPDSLYDNSGRSKRGILHGARKFISILEKRAENYDKERDQLLQQRVELINRLKALKYAPHRCTPPLSFMEKPSVQPNPDVIEDQATSQPVRPTKRAQSQLGPASKRRRNMETATDPDQEGNAALDAAPDNASEMTSAALDSAQDAAQNGSPDDDAQVMSVGQDDNELSFTITAVRSLVSDASNDASTPLTGTSLGSSSSDFDREHFLSDEDIDEDDDDDDWND